MSTRFWNGLPGIICKTCNGIGQERYKSASLPPEFNCYGGRYEDDMFIRVCRTCSGVGALEDHAAISGASPYVESYNQAHGLQGASGLESLIGGAIFRFF